MNIRWLGPSLEFESVSVGSGLRICISKVPGVSMLQVPGPRLDTGLEGGLALAHGSFM